MDERKPARIIGIRINPRALSAALAGAVLLATLNLAPMALASAQSERGKGITDDDFKPLILCDETQDPAWRALNCPFPLNSYRLHADYEDLSFLENGRVTIAEIPWNYYRASVETVFSIMWTALTMPWMNWFVGTADNISLAFLSMLRGLDFREALGVLPTPVTTVAVTGVGYGITAGGSQQTSGTGPPRVGIEGWWLVILATILFIGAWKIVRPFRIERKGATPDPGSDLVAGLKFIAGGCLWLVIFLVVVNWHGPSPFGPRVTAAECADHLNPDKRKDGCVSGLTRAALLPMTGMMKLAAGLNAGASEIYDFVQDEGAKSAPLRLMAIRGEEGLLKEMGADPGVWAPYIASEHLWSDDVMGIVNAIAPANPNAFNPLDRIKSFFDCSYTLITGDWRCEHDISSGRQKGGSIFAGAGAGESFGESTLFTADSLSDHFRCRFAPGVYKSSTAADFDCNITKLPLLVQTQVAELTALAEPKVMVTRLTPCLEPVGDSIPDQNQIVQFVITDAVAAARALQSPARKGSPQELLACRVLQPWKKQMLHAMWETVQLGYSPNPLGAELINRYQRGSPDDSAYPARPLTNGESIAMLLWASTAGGGGKVNTDLLHNLQFEEAVVTPLERGHYNTGAIIGGGLTIIAAYISALIMLFLMLYATFHMLIVIGLFPLTAAFFPIPKLRNVAIRSLLSLVRSTILVGGMLVFVFAMGILQEIIFDITEEVPAVLSALFLAGGQLMLLYFPFKLFSWSKKTNTKIKARLQNDATWKQLRGGGVAGLKQFGKDVGQDMRAAGRETLGSNRSLTADQGGKLPAKSAAGGGATSVSAKPGSSATSAADRAGILAGVAGMPAKRPSKAAKPDSPATTDRTAKPRGGAKTPSTDAAKEVAALRIGKGDAAGIAAFGGLGGQSPEVGAKKPGDVGGEDVATAPSATPSALGDAEGQMADEGVSLPQDGGVVGEQVETAGGPLSTTVGGTEVPADQHPEDGQEESAELSEGDEGYLEEDDPFALKKRGIGKATGEFVKSSIKTGGSAALRKVGETELGQSLKGAKESIKSAYTVPKSFATAYREGGWETLKPARELKTDHDKKAMESILSDGEPDYRSLLGVLQNQHRNERAEQIRNQKFEEALKTGDKTFKDDKKILQDQEKGLTDGQQAAREDMNKAIAIIKNPKVYGKDPTSDLKKYHDRRDGREAEIKSLKKDQTAARERRKAFEDSYEQWKGGVEELKEKQIWVDGDNFDSQVSNAAATRMLLSSPDDISEDVRTELLKDKSSRQMLRQAASQLKGDHRDLALEHGWGNLLGNRGQPREGQ